MGKLLVSITGLNQFSISFENTIPCEYQSLCKFGKRMCFPFRLNVRRPSNAFNASGKRHSIKPENAKAGESFEDIEKKIKINVNSIFSEIWEN